MLYFYKLPEQLPTGLTIDGTPATGIHSGSGNLTCSLTVPTAGDIIVVNIHVTAVSAQGAHPVVTGVSSPTLGAFTQRGSVVSQVASFGNQSAVYVFWAYASTALSAETITVAIAGSPLLDDGSVIAFGVTGFTGTSYHTVPWDQNVSLPASANVANSSSIPSVSGVSTTNPSTMLLGLFGSSDNSTQSAGSGFTIVSTRINAGGSATSSNAVEQRVFSTAQSGITVAFGSAVSDWLMVADALSLTGGSVAPSGTLAVTEAQDVAAFTGTVAGITGTLATTEGQDVAAFTATFAITGTLATTEAQDVAAFTATFAITGTLATTEGQDTASFTGSGVAPSGTLNTTEAQDVAAFTGNTVTSGTLATTEAQDTAAFTGSASLPASGTLAVTEAPDIASFAGSVAGVPTGTLSATEAPDNLIFLIDYLAPPPPAGGQVPYPSKYDYGWYNRHPPLRR